MKTLESYTGTFLLGFGVSFVDKCIKHIVDDIVSSEYLLSRTGGTFVRYIWFAKLCLKNNGLLILIEQLSVDVAGAKYLGVSHVDSFVLYSLESNEVELKIEAVDYFIKKPTKNTTIHLASFYNTANSALAEVMNM